MRMPRSVWFKSERIITILFFGGFSILLFSCVMDTKKYWKYTICDMGGSCNRTTSYQKTDEGVIFRYKKDRSEIVGQYSIKGR